MRKLKYLASIVSGQAPSGDNVADSGTLPFLQGCAEFGASFPKPTKYCESPSKIAPENAILVSVRAPVGKMNVADQKYGIGRGLAAVVALPNVHRVFLGYAIESFIPELKSNSTGSTYDAVSGSDIGNLAVPNPDLATQCQIANFLDRETARIDLLIEKKQKLVALLGDRLTSLITNLAKDGLMRETLIETGFDWWSHAPTSWQVHRIASLFQESKEMGEEGLPVLSVSINWGISDHQLADEDRDRIVNHIEDKTSYKRVRVGDLVYNMMRAWQGAFGVAKVDGLVSPAYVVARPKKGLHPIYFEHLLRTPSCVEEFRRASKGIADFRQRLYWEHFRQVRLVIPPYGEQVIIAERIGHEQARSAPIMAKTQGSIDRLKEYRSALITAAVTGQIDVATYAKFGTTDHRLDAIQEEMRA